MPGAGTDKTRNWIEAPGPIIVLVEPQLGENIGAAARVMANFGLARLRLVKPRDGWPNIHAQRSASGADRILETTALFDSVEAAIADCTVVLATTARAHDQAKPVLGPDEAAAFLAPHVAAGESAAVLFGRERYGLENDEVALADRIVTFPVNPAFASLNLAQAVAVIAYEWFKLACGGTLPFAMPQKSSSAGKEHGQDGAAPACGPMRGLSRLLRRNPTDAERALWHALTNDRRFAGKGIKRQVPVGPHITDFVSFPLRLVIELVPAQESKIAAKARGERRTWLSERGYRVLEVEADAVEADLPQVLDQL